MLFDFNKKPYLAGIFHASAVTVAIRWLLVIFPKTYNTQTIGNGIFMVLFTVMLWSYYITLISEPGFVPLPGSMADRRKTIEGLVQTGELDKRQFCTVCFHRKPLRSKHCRLCNRCVAKHDQ